MVTPHTRHLEFEFPTTAGLEWPNNFSGPPTSPEPASAAPEDDDGDDGMLDAGDDDGFFTPVPGTPNVHSPATGAAARGVKSRVRAPVRYDFGLVDQSCWSILRECDFDPNTTLPERAELLDPAPVQGCQEEGKLNHTRYEPEQM